MDLYSKALLLGGVIGGSVRGFLTTRSLMSADVLLAWIKILTAMKMVSTVSITLIPGKIITRLIPVAGR